MSQISNLLSNKKLDRQNDGLLELLNSVTVDEVRGALRQSPGEYSLNRMLTLISPAGQDCLEEMAQQAAALTVQRFGRTVQLYAPLYVSNYCCNSCLYCGYNTSTKFKRTRLTIDQAVAEADIIASEGFRHILLVSGEDPKFVTCDYLNELAEKLRSKFSSVSIEIQPLSTEEYAKVFRGGIDGVTLYQETYDRETYARYHKAGPKSDYNYRLDTHDRTAAGGMRRLGVGFLLGLSDWRLETLAMSEHAAYLMKNYWRAQVSFSFPRMRPALNVAEQYQHLVNDKELVQLMLALRLCFADAGIVLSTRESAAFRDNLVKLCVTRMSAGSKTNPGGYSGDGNSTEQFEIDDDRSAGQVVEMLKTAGKECVWKDWDAGFVMTNYE
ncbi:MAG: 2-iminoacetate synthase ThiH [Phycisphaerae bacterium]|nr:2-iminoacetate synthase ThiH [Phycisphaerae bacterium]